jgi:hypothetical protein
MNCTDKVDTIVKVVHRCIITINTMDITILATIIVAIMSDEEQLGCNGYPSDYPLRSYRSDGWDNSHCMDMRFGPFRFDEQMEVSGQYIYLHCQGYAYISIPIIQLFGHGSHGEDDQSTIQRSH